MPDTAVDRVPRGIALLTAHVHGDEAALRQLVALNDDPVDATIDLAYAAHEFLAIAAHSRGQTPEELLALLGRSLMSIESTVEKIRRLRALGQLPPSP